MAAPVPTSTTSPETTGKKNGASAYTRAKLHLAAPRNVSSGGGRSGLTLIASAAKRTFKGADRIRAALPTNPRPPISRYTGDTSNANVQRCGAAGWTGNGVSVGPGVPAGGADG